MKPDWIPALIVTVVASAAASAAASAPPIVQKVQQEDKGDRRTPARRLPEARGRVLKIHDQAAKGAPPLKETHDPGEIKNAQDSLGARIRELRAAAKPGDVITPDMAALMRRLLAPELKHEDGKDAKKVMKDDAPPTVPFKVNAKYPPSSALPTVPTTLLSSLPTLPKQLEYRIIGKHLILRDVDADIIVDFALNVNP